jgi:nitroreductase
MEFYEASKNRRTVREFSAQPVEEAKLLRILGAGLCAPTHNHLRQWEYCLIRDRAVREAIVDIGEGLSDAVDSEGLRQQFSGHEPSAREMYLKAIPLQKRMLLTAPELLVVCYKISRPIKECTTLYELNSLASVWCCIENILWPWLPKGCTASLHPQNTERIRQILGVPNDYEIPSSCHRISE